MRALSWRQHIPSGINDLGDLEKMTNETRTLLESAVRKLGPIGAQNALTAFQTGHDSRGWQACALACSFGARGELEAEVMSRINSGPWWARRYSNLAVLFGATAADIIGLTRPETDTAVQAFDGWLGDEVRAAFRDLLRIEAAKIATPRVVAEPSGEAPEVSCGETVSAG